MVDGTPTANYGWIKPNIGSSIDIWGGELNADLDGIDSVVHALASGGAASVNVFNNRAAIQAATIPAATQMIIGMAYATPGDLRGDVMVFKRVASLPTYPGFVRSADRFLPSGATDATNGGYWQLAMNEVNVFMFGALGIGNSANDDWPAISAALSYCNNRINSVPSTQNSSLVTLKFPNCNGYYSSQTIPITNTMRVIGTGWGANYHSALPIQFPVGITGMTIAGTAYGSHIKGLSLIGVLDKPLANPIAHGFSISTTVTLENCGAVSFSGCGFLMNGSTPVSTDLSRFIYCIAETNGRHGFYTYGTDSQVSMYDLCNAVSNGGWGFFDSAEFGNKYDTCHASGNGTQTTQGNVSDSISPVVAYPAGGGGHLYMAAPFSPGTANMVGTPPLTGTTTPGTNSAVWFPIGGAVAGFPVWSSGGKYREGGDWCSYFGTPQFVNCYTEGGTYSWLASPSPWFGLTAPNTAQDSSATFWTDGQCTLGIKGSWGTFFKFQNGSTVASQDITIYNGPGHTPPVDSIRYVQASVAGSYSEYLSSGDFVSQFGSNAIWAMTGAATARAYGSSAPQPGVFEVARLGLSNGGGGLTIDSGAAPPTTGVAAVGWIRINQFPSGLGQPLGWVCTTGGTNGSTSVWTPIIYDLAPNTVANLPGASGRQGVRGLVTNSNATLAAGIGNTVAGGGSNIVPVFSDGTNWKIG